MKTEQQNLMTSSNLREQRARAILEKGNPSQIDEYTYLVPSQFDSNKKYKVTHLDSYSCECEDYQRRCKNSGLYCKHIKAILIFEKIKNAYEVEETPIKREVELIIEQPQKDNCPYCNSSELIKRGVRLTKLGEKQRYSCLVCKKRFVLSAIPKIKGNAKLVCLAMDCFYKGLSYRDIADQFKQFYGLELHHETIRRWILRFSEVMEKYTKTIQPQIKGVWNADETLILTKRGRDKKNPLSNENYDYVWNCMNKETKFLLASINSGRSRSSKDAQKVFSEAVKQNGKIPFQIIVDGYAGYQDGCRKTFRNWGAERKVKFTSIKGHRKEINNNAIESHHALMKDFHKVRKGVKEVQTYQDGFKVFHNFVRKSAREDLTPADKCGIGVQGNRWNTLLLNSIKQKVPIVTGEDNLAISP